VDNNFQGDSLLRVTGSVAIPLGLEGRDLVPVLAFEANSPKNDHVCGYSHDASRIVEVEARGDFPSRFTIDVFDPPPEDTIIKRQKDSPAYAIGYIAAVPAKHPDAILALPPDEKTFRRWRDIEVEECGDLIPPAGGTKFCAMLHACTIDAKHCLHRTLHCDLGTQVANFNECDLVNSRGDKSLAVAGYSVNYAVLYFPKPIKAGTQVAKAWANGSAITPGYHLYRIEKAKLASSPDQMQCIYDSFDVAGERYNAEHGTDFNWADLLQATPETGGAAAYLDLLCLAGEARAEKGCNTVDFDKTVKEVDHGPVSIDLGTFAPYEF
jgi:hypothetical protein